MRVWFALLFLVSCSRTQTAPDAAIEASASDAASEAQSEDEVKPVYPDAPADPLAQKLCTALHTTEAKRKAECCKTTLTGTAPGLATECTRNLSSAMKLGTVALDSAAVDACIVALDATYAGCDWVGPLAPPVPAVCQGLLQGKLASGAKCRSTLECKEGWCHGVGPTTVGTCGAAHADGESCGGSADVLVTYARQDAIENVRAECTGVCLRGRCLPRSKEGSACGSSEQCESGTQCRSAKCVKTAGKAGERCGTCESPLACQPSGKCGPLRKPAGSACANDLECTGGCVKSAATAKSGVCGMRCD